MKFLLVVLAIAAFAHAGPAEWKVRTSEELMQIHKECFAEHPFSDELYQKLNHFEYPDEEPVRQLLLCDVTKLGAFTEAEGYNVPRMVQQFKMGLEESEALTIIEGCVAKTPSDTTSAKYVFRAQVCIISSKIGEKFKEMLKKEQEKENKTA